MVLIFWLSSVFWMIVPALVSGGLIAWLLSGLDVPLLLESIAELPWVHGVRVMPDVHLGKGATVGSVIAMEHAGLGRGRLYPGSWSQWSNTDRPAATGPRPGSKVAIDPTGSISG